MDVTFLGTASAYPTPNRGVSSLVFRNDGVHWMVDCGEGSQIQLMKSNLKSGKITKIFVTHLHGDHIFGMPGILCTISANYPEDNKPLFEIYGPLGLRRFLRETLTLSRSILGFDYVVHELIPIPEQYPENYSRWLPDHKDHGPLHPCEKPGRDIEMDNNVWDICREHGMTVKAGRVKHWVPTFGYVIEENPLPGRLDAAKLKQMGVPPGPLYAKLKAGKSIQAPDGKTIAPEEVMGAARRGRKVAILGDSSNSTFMSELCQEADLLVHESTLCDGLEDMAHRKGHSTAGMAGQFARDIQAKMLAINHFSQRYRSRTDPKYVENPEDTDNTTIQDILQQAKAAFENDNVVLGEDLVTVTVPNRR